MLKKDMLELFLLKIICKYYRLTPLGRKKLQALLDEWQQLCDFLAGLEPK